MGNNTLNELFDLNGAWGSLKPLLKYPEYRAHKILMLYISPILLVLGVCGNFMSFFILRQKRNPRSSTYTFLTSLAVADTMVLLVGLFPRWLGELIGFDVRFQANWLCKTMVMLGYFCSNISTWIVVAVTIERFLVVYYPLKVLGLYSVALARKIIGGLYALFLSLNIHFLWTVGLVDEKESYPNQVCGAVVGNEYLITVIWPWVDAVVYCLLPFFTIGIFNVLIILKVRRTARQRALLQKVCLRKQKATSLDTSFCLTWMLLSVSFAFLLCKLPMNISIIASVFLNSRGHSNAEMSKFQLFFTISELLMHLNHSSNFFLYCASGQKFRNDVLNMFCWKNGQHDMVSSVGSPHSWYRNTRKEETFV
ncbi:thyrotropin-releasing hormone receptor-like [Haliotis rubra]|uniref:thyrotropin-releasing hormone receptor-like n=1 Tax=Haliotis rubra TaxID=36100 RepID=UPI001EE54CEF|nr:thyrotropin-releasing hormone receptor-like [Haliotis rubra]